MHADQLKMRFNRLHCKSLARKGKHPPPSCPTQKAREQNKNESNPYLRDTAMNECGRGRDDEKRQNKIKQNENTSPNKTGFNEKTDLLCISNIYRYV